MQFRQLAEQSQKNPLVRGKENVNFAIRSWVAAIGADDAYFTLKA
jgi:hypothetical protein